MIKRKRIYAVIIIIFIILLDFGGSIRIKEFDINVDNELDIQQEDKQGVMVEDVSEDIELDEKILEDDYESICREEDDNKAKLIENQRQNIKDYDQYSQNSVLLEGIEKEEAEKLAQSIGGTIRKINNSDYSVLYIPNDKNVEDVFVNTENEKYLNSVRLDYYISLCDINVDSDISNSGENEYDHNSSSPRLKVTKNRPIISVNDDYYDMQEYLDYIDIHNTWNVTKGEGVKVAIIDSGIDIDHPEFKGRISEMSYNVSEDKIVKTSGMSVIDDNNGHGTAVAGVIGASINNKKGIVGIAPEVELLVIKCESNSNNVIKMSDVLFGISYAIEQGADVINMSFCSQINYFTKYINLAVDNDIICVAAMGNGGSSIPMYPASCEGVIGVGAYDEGSDTKAEYSNYGEGLDVLAPGTAYTTSINGKYRVVTGTSVSCPMVSAAVALYISKNKKRVTCEKMHSLIQASSIDLGTLGADYYNGFGELDIYALVCEKKGIITYNMQTDEVNDYKQIFVYGRTIQYMPEPEREYVVLDGWYFDQNCNQFCNYYTTVFKDNITLYAGWVNEDEGIPYTYIEKKDGTIEITSYTGKRRFLTIPDKIAGKKVTSIGSKAFSDNTRLRMVILPQSLKYIYKEAFSDCIMLSEIQIPDSLVYIGDMCFYGCYRLNNITFGSGSNLKYIGSKAFAYNGLEEFVIPSKLSSLGEAVFYGDLYLKRIKVIPGNTNYKIINEALYDITGKELIYYPTGLSGEYSVNSNTKVIGTNAFAFSRLINIEMNEGIKKIGYGAFFEAQITKVIIPSSVTILGENAFEYCDNLKNVKFSQNSKIRVISENAFSFTSSLRNITIPKSVEEISKYAFLCSGLETLRFDSICKVNMIGDFAFYGTNIKVLVIPDSVTEIGESAFKNDSMLQTVEFGKNSKCIKVGDKAFENDYMLNTFRIPDSVNEIGMDALCNSGVRELTIGAGLIDIKAGAFASCPNLNNIYVSDNNTAYTSIDGVMLNKNKSIILAFPAGREGKYECPESIYKIGSKSFYGAKKLTYIKFNNKITNIDKYAFSKCIKLTTPVFPSSIQAIGKAAFHGCVSMDTPLLPSNLKRIEEFAFSDCFGMKQDLIIPSSVINIGRFAFSNDYGLKNIEFESNSRITRIGYASFANCGITDFTIPNGVSSMGQEVFSGCKNLLTLTFENGSKLVSIPAWVLNNAPNLRRITFEKNNSLKVIQARAFEKLTMLEVVDLSECKKLTSIGNHAFSNCKSLSKVILSDPLESIGRYAFYGCSSLTRLDLPKSITSIGEYAFSGTKKIKLYFKSAFLPDDLMDNWDYGIGAYFVDVNDVIENENWIYAKTTDGKASIIKYKGNAEEINLNEINGLKIIAIGNDAFLNNKTLKKISLPVTLKAIYKSAFRGTAALETVTIPNNVKIIDSGAFANSGVKYVNISTKSRIEVIGSGAFESTKNLRSIYIPDGVSEIREKTFYNSGISNVRLPDSLTKIGRLAFSEVKIETLQIPSGVKIISSKAFMNNTQLSSVEFAPTGTKLSINEECFYNTGITSVSIPKYVNNIGEYAFANCRSLTSINVSQANNHYASSGGILYNKDKSILICCPAGKTGKCVISKNVLSLAFGAFEGAIVNEIVFSDECYLSTIGHRAFWGCEKIKSIKIPSNINSIESYAFANCISLECIDLNDDKINIINTGAFYGCKKLKSIIIPDTVLDISSYAFYGCESLFEVNFKKSSKLRYIGEYAFANSGISQFIMPSFVEEVGDYAFSNTVNLSNIKFNNKLIRLGDYAFEKSGLTGQAEIVVPSSVEYIGVKAFQGVKELSLLSVPFMGAKYEQNGWIGGNEKKKLDYLFGNYKELSIGKMIIRSGSYVSMYAFSRVTSNGTVPAKIKYLYLPSTVNEIGFRAFSGARISYIKLPEGIKTISEDAFSGSSIIKINIPNSVEILEENAFEDCEELKEITIGKNIKQIGINAFNNCFMLKHVYFEDGVRQIGKGAFVNTAIESIVIPDSVEKIDESTFCDCLSLKEVTIGNGVKTIGEKAFYGCKKLETVYFGKQISSIGSGSFENCNNLSNISINSKNINFTVFENCLYKKDFSEIVLVPRGIENIILSKKLKRIGDNSFSGGNMRSISIPGTIEEIGIGAFQNCSKLKTVILENGTKTINDYAFKNCKNLQDIAFPDSIEHIGKNAFEECESITNLDLTKNITYIGDYAFSGCSSLLKVNFMCSAKVINKGAFSDCISLYEVNLSDNVKTICDDAFDNCALEYISLPKGITNLSPRSFGATLKYIDVDKNNKNLVSLNGIVYDKNIKQIKYVPNISGVITLPDGLETVDNYAFYGRTKVEKVIIPDSVTTIGNNAFRDCLNLSEVLLSSNINEIGENAFFQCRKLSSLCLPQSITSIKKCTFYGSGIQTINIPSNVVSIGEQAFAGCENLKLINLPTNLEIIEGEAFEGCVSLEYIKIPNSVKTISYAAFRGCESLSNIKCGNNISKLGDSVFDDTAYSYDKNNYFDNVLYLGCYAVGVSYDNMVYKQKYVRIKEGTKVLSDMLFSYKIHGINFYFDTDSCISRVILPKSLEVIGEKAFAFNKNLNYINFDINIKTIGDYAFEECGLISIDLSECRLKPSIGNGAFEHNSNLKDVKVYDMYNSRGIGSNEIRTYSGAKLGPIYPQNLIINNEYDLKNIDYLINDNYTVYTRLTKEEVDGYFDPSRKVYYKGEWNLATFYLDGVIIEMLPVIYGKVVNEPAESIVKKAIPENAEFLGWDINGDDIVDKIPVKLTKDLKAVAVYNAPIQSVSIIDKMSIMVGNTRKLEVNTKPSGHNQDAIYSWSSADEKIAVVDQNGIVTGIKEGVTYISVKLKSNSKIVSKCKVTVLSKPYGISLELDEMTINVGDTYLISKKLSVPEGYTANYEFISNDTSIAKVNNKGLVTGLSGGVAEITITYGEDYSTKFRIIVNNPITNVELTSTSGKISINETKKISVKITPIDTTDDKKIVWISKDDTIATVNTKGEVTGVGPGNTKIIGIIGNYKLTYSITVIVPLEKIVMNTSKSVIRLDQKKQLEVIFIPSNTTVNKDVTWISADPEIASVDENGLVTAHNNGVTIITAKVGEFEATYKASVIGIRDEATGIVISNTDNTEMDSEMSFVVEQISEVDAEKEFGDYKGNILLKIKDRNGRIYLLFVYDLSLLFNGDVIQPSKRVNIDIPVPEWGIKKGAAVYRVEENGDYTDMCAQYKNGKYHFSTEHFSKYFLAVPTDKFEVAEIKLEKNAYSTSIGKSISLSPIIIPEAAEDKRVSYSSSNVKVATVDNKGMIKAVGKGTAIITISSKAVAGVEAKCKVVVKDRLTQIAIPKANTGLVFDGKEKIGISSSKNYTVKNNRATDAGTYSAIVSLKDLTATEWADGTQEDKIIVWKISPKPIGNVIGVELSTQKYNYDGKEKKPSVTVTYDNITLKKGIDFTVTYLDNIDVGKAKVLLKGNGNYTFTKTLAFYIVPVITLQPKNQRSFYGDYAEFIISVSGNDPQFQWQVSSDGNTWKNSGGDGNKTSSLSIEASASLNGKKYRCMVTCGDNIIYSKTVVLTTKSNITVQPKDAIVSNGSTVMFVTEAQGRAVKYQWQYSNDKGKTWYESKSEGYNTNELYISAKVKYNNYLFRCKVSNGNSVVYTKTVKLSIE